MNKDLETIVRWVDREDKNADPVKFYRLYYNGLNRSQLAITDNALYRSLIRNKRLPEAIPEADERAVENGRKIGRKVIYNFGGNPLKYYRRHYPGLTRGQLYQANQALYDRLIRDGLIGEVPTRSELKERKNLI